MKVNKQFFIPSLDNEEFTDEEELAKAFAFGLKELRKDRGYTLKKVSEGTEIPIPTIQRYESGENCPTIVQAFKLAYFYKVNLQDIFMIGDAKDISVLDL